MLTFKNIVEGQAEAVPFPELNPDLPIAPVPDETIELASKGFVNLFFRILMGDKSVAGENFSGIEECINKIMMTEHNDAEFIPQIRQFKTMSELGDPKNRKHLFYVQSKIIRFITLDPKDIFKCLDIIYIIPDDLCEIGLTGDSMKVLANLLNLDFDLSDKTKIKNTKAVHNVLVKYIPDIVKKIIDISEEYESNKCNGKPHPNTLMMKNIYTNLFVNNNINQYFKVTTTTIFY